MNLFPERTGESFSQYIRKDMTENQRKKNDELRSKKYQLNQAKGPNDPPFVIRGNDIVQLPKNPTNGRR